MTKYESNEVAEAVGEEGVGAPEYCKVTQGIYRLILNGTGGPNTQGQFFSAGLNLDPDSGLSMPQIQDCLVPDGSGNYQVVFTVMEGQISGGSDYTVEVMFMSSSSPHFYRGTWPSTPIGDCTEASPCD